MFRTVEGAIMVIENGSIKNRDRVCLVSCLLCMCLSLLPASPNACNGVQKQIRYRIQPFGLMKEAFLNIILLPIRISRQLTVLVSIIYAYANKVSS
jgi:hypothetical protein